MLEKLKNSACIKALNEILNSKYFPAIIAGIVLFTHCLALDVTGFIVLIVITVLINIFCDDLRPAVPVFIMIAYVVSSQHSPGKIGSSGNLTSNYYLQTWVLVVLGCLVAIWIISFIARTIIYKEYKNWYKKRSLLLGFILLVPCYLCAGLFTKYYDVNSLFIGGTMVVWHFVFYVVFSSAMFKREDNVEYLAKTCFYAMVVMMIEILFYYILYYKLGDSLDVSWKGNMHIGSVVSNSSSEFIVMMLPFAIYLAYNDKRGYIYYTVSILSIIAIYFTLSRAALLFGVPVIVVGTILLCIKGRFKVLYRIIAITITSILAIGLAYVFIGGHSEGFFEFFINAGLKDSGRISIWKELLSYFKDWPIFGVGFSTYMQNHPDKVPVILQGLAHNTVVQIIGSTGIVGTLCFVVHRYQTVKLFVHKPTIERSVIGTSLFLFIAIGLLDQTFFFPNFAMLYTLLLVIAENEKERTENHLLNNDNLKAVKE